jgi:hypothetical protein
MRLLDMLTGTKRPAAGVAPTGAGALRDALLSINRPTAPFIVRDGAPEQCDLAAEWRIVDAAWYEIFAKAGLRRVFKVLMRLDAGRHEVRAVDREFAVNGVPASPPCRQRRAPFAAGRWNSPPGRPTALPRPAFPVRSTDTDSPPAS